MKQLNGIILIIKSKPDAVSQAVANITAQVLQIKRKVVLGLCTGNTAIPIYERLISLYLERAISFRDTVTFNLDEYYPAHPKETNSYQNIMRQELFNHVDISAANIHFPNSLSHDPHQAGQQYEALIKQHGGIDLQLLGIGQNAHIGYNEPGSSPDSQTRLITLTEETKQANAYAFDSLDDMPPQALTMGIDTILNARKIVLAATGSHKAKAVQQALTLNPNPAVPASYLQNHPNCTFIIDEEAAKLLSQ